MSILSGHDLAKYYGAQDVFSGVSFDLARGDKVALVGPNGAGKTTLLRIILGQEDATEGQVSRAKSLQMGYLPQKPHFDSDQHLYDEMLTVFAELRQQERRLQLLADEMAHASHTEDLMQRFARAQTQFELGDGYGYENRIKHVLMGLGFGPETHSWPIAMLSGGQVTRALLAKLLLQEPELLVLDEPTNHLDLDALEWLETYLQSWPKSLLIVSHDRYFLDRVVSRVWELNHGRLVTFRGNYTHYVQQLADRQESQERAYKRQQAFIAKTEDFIQRYKAGQRSKEARGRQTRLNRMERIRRPERERDIKLRFGAKGRSGNDVLMTEGAVIGYPGQPDDGANGKEGNRPNVLFRTGELLIQRGQRVAMLGANGCGKTTFVRTILREIESLEGTIRHGASLKIGYLPQRQDWLDTGKSVLDHILDASRLTIGEARSLLGRYLFSGDDVFKTVGQLSGGERSRLALALLAMAGANLLILDEPTTHLDVASQEILQDVLADFDGTMLAVSHDRYLIDAIATHVWVVKDGQLAQYEGNYSDYVSERQRLAEEKASVRSEKGRPVRRSIQPRSHPQRYLRRLDALESDIERLESRVDELTQYIDLASAVQDVERLCELGDEYGQVRDELATQLSEWERLASELETEPMQE